ncbi:MAG: hypothetical protein DRI40_08935 [Chloroflexi bacterium]|nr:MAG: hypothetical protein DRI40_08935 [Chloroflexota bacterium]
MRAHIQYQDSHLAFNTVVASGYFCRFTLPSDFHRFQAFVSIVLAKIPCRFKKGASHVSHIAFPDLLGIPGASYPETILSQTRGFSNNGDSAQWLLPSFQ